MILVTEEYESSDCCVLQPIEAALNICCGGYTALVGQFKEAGKSCDLMYQPVNLYDYHLA